MCIILQQKYVDAVNAPKTESLPKKASVDRRTVNMLRFVDSIIAPKTADTSSDWQPDELTADLASQIDKLRDKAATAKLLRSVISAQKKGMPVPPRLIQQAAVKTQASIKRLDHNVGADMIDQRIADNYGGGTIVGSLPPRLNKPGLTEDVLLDRRADLRAYIQRIGNLKMLPEPGRYHPPIYVPDMPTFWQRLRGAKLPKSRHEHMIDDVLEAQAKLRAFGNDPTDNLAANSQIAAQMPPLFSRGFAPGSTTIAWPPQR